MCTIYAHPYATYLLLILWRAACAEKKVIPDSPHPLICASSGQPPDEPK